MLSDTLSGRLESFDISSTYILLHLYCPSLKSVFLCFCVQWRGCADVFLCAKTQSDINLIF